jgi:hypothetical protein
LDDTSATRWDSPVLGEEQLRGELAPHLQPPPPTTPDHKEVTMKTQIRIASLALLAVLCLMLPVIPAVAGTLYSNGPYNGNAAAWGIGGNQVVTDSTNLNSSRSNVYAIDFVYWDASETDLLTTVDMSFGLHRLAPMFSPGR